MGRRRDRERGGDRERERDRGDRGEREFRDDRDRKFQKRSGPQPEDICYNCGKIGHW